ncbi:MAG: hypothetical protein HKN23_12470 [Verrucomicrobiales bacterium]|nr:hypothetical protein [Verrucomicrobiales bacterium]
MKVNSDCSFNSPRCMGLFLAAVGLLYAAGLNPWVMPESTDDITYFELAKSYAAGNGHEFQGEVIGDWPPIFPLYLSVPMRLGMESLLTAKITVVLSMLAALFLASRLIVRENREAPWTTLILTAVIPTAYASGVRSSSDWFFAAITFGFFLWLHRMNRRETPSLRDGIVLGVLLGIAALTRQVGVLLGAAIVVQILSRWWRSDSRWQIGSVLRQNWPEILAAFIGATLWLAWGAYLAKIQSVDVLAKGNYDQLGTEMWMNFEPVRLLSHLAEAWFQFSNLTEIAGFDGGPVETALLILFGIVLAIGLVQTIRQGRFLPSDGYGVATILLLLPYLFKTPRFWIVLTPFLLSWFFRGLAVFWKPVAGRLPVRAATWIPRAAGGFWIAFSVAVCGILITRGNAHHAALSPLITKSEDEFYRGYYADLREAGIRAAAIEPKPDKVGIYGWYSNSFYTWSGGLNSYNWQFWPEEIDWFVTSPDEPDLPTELQDTGEFRKILTEGSVSVFERTGADR